MLAWRKLLLGLNNFAGWLIALCSPALKPFHREIRYPRGRWLLYPFLLFFFILRFFWQPATYRYADNLLASSCSTLLTMPPRQNPSCLKLSRARLPWLILFNYLHVYVIRLCTCRFTRRASVFFLTHFILSIYYLFRREKSRHVENRIA